MTLKLRLLDEELYAEDLVLPLLDKDPLLRGTHRDDAGLDLRASKDVRVHGGETAVIGLGIAVAIPPGHVGWLTGRSTTALKMGLFVHEGKIDSGYRGEIHAFVTAQGSPVDVKRGDRLAQLVCLVIERPSWNVVGKLEDTDRGTRGLGSSGLR